MFKKFFIFSGRLNRKSFFWLSVIIFIFSTIGLTLSEVANQLYIQEQTSAENAQILTIAGIVLFLIAQISFFSLAVRRLRDIKWSPWLVILLFLPLISFILLLILFFKPTIEEDTN